MKIRSREWSLLLSTLLLTSVGLLFVFLASTAEAAELVGNQYFFLRQQAIRVALGLGGLFIGWVIPHRLWQKTAVFWYALSLFLLVLVFVPGIGRELNGAHRWILLGSGVFQPIEVVKFGVLVFLSQRLTHHQSLWSFLLITGIPLGLVIAQPDLGSLLILLLIGAGLFFVAGGNIRSLLILAGIGLLFVIIAMASSSYRRERVLTYLDPERDPLGASFHIRQITLALGNGGWFGQGLGNSRQKYSYIPEASTDSIFAIVAEEIGFVGAAGILLAFLWYFWSLSAAALMVKDSAFSYLLVSGILIWIGGQVMVNIAAVVALIPLTGIPLPFFSYGGTSTVMTLFATGVALRAHRER